MTKIEIISYNFCEKYFDGIYIEATTVQFVEGKWEGEIIFGDFIRTWDEELWWHAPIRQKINTHDYNLIAQYIRDKGM
ncbi:MAG: hypothetical protein HC836_41780 [Richelia sp. RM2_1_2]|nr:hypothetical protein [Richelia sp. RM2_1_2]